MSATAVKGMTKNGGSRNGKDTVNGGIIKGRAEDWTSLGREPKSVAVEKQGPIHSGIRASGNKVHRQSQGSNPRFLILRAVPLVMDPLSLTSCIPPSLLYPLPRLRAPRKQKPDLGRLFVNMDF